MHWCGYIRGWLLFKGSYYLRKYGSTCSCAETLYNKMAKPGENSELFPDVMTCFAFIFWLGIREAGWKGKENYQLGTVKAWDKGALKLIQCSISASKVGTMQQDTVQFQKFCPLHRMLTCTNWTLLTPRIMCTMMTLVQYMTDYAWWLLSDLFVL